MCEACPEMANHNEPAQETEMDSAAEDLAHAEKVAPLIEALHDSLSERDKARADAERLAEAGRQLGKVIVGSLRGTVTGAEVNEAVFSMDAALAAHEEEATSSGAGGVLPRDPLSTDAPAEADPAPDSIAGVPTKDLWARMEVPKANLGMATTSELLDELKARAEVGGYWNYRTVD